MSSFNPLHFADKENALKKPIHRKNDSLLNQVSNENKISKYPGKTQQQNSARRTRIPLGGKDQNKAFPSLQRSQSNINQSTHLKSTPFSLNRNVNINIQPSQVQSKPKFQDRRKVLIPKVPTLRKANSSLGFVHHQKNALSERLLKIKQANPLKNDLFGKVQQSTSTTDSLTKKTTHQLPSISNLKSTISLKTNSLNASNINNRDLYRNDVDPIKKIRGVATRIIIPQHLIDDENSIEIVPQKEPALPYKPFDMDSLSEDDLQAFSNSNPPKETKENKYEYPEIHQNEIKLKFEEIDLDNELIFDHEEINEIENSVDLKDQPKLESVGLTVDELNDLLDF